MNIHLPRFRAILRDLVHINLPMGVVSGSVVNYHNYFYFLF